MELAAWHANPCTEEQASRLLGQAREAQQRAYSRGAQCFECRIEEMIGLFWCRRPIDACFLNLRKTAPDEGSSALVELVYGQLLMSCKLDRAMEHLTAGFTRATPYLAAADYFALLRRHTLLAHLPLSGTPSPPLDLDSLLREAGVIRVFKSSSRRRPGGHPGGDPHDTTG